VFDKRGMTIGQYKSGCLFFFKKLRHINKVRTGKKKRDTSYSQRDLHLC